MLEELQCLECRLDDSSKIIGKADREKLLENRGGLGREREEELVSIVFNILFRFTSSWCTLWLVDRFWQFTSTLTLITWLVQRRVKQTWRACETLLQLHILTRQIVFLEVGWGIIKNACRLSPSLLPPFFVARPRFFLDGTERGHGTGYVWIQLCKRSTIFPDSPSIAHEFNGIDLVPSMSFSTWRTNQGCLTVLQQSPKNIFLPKSDDKCLSFLWKLNL